MIIVNFLNDRTSTFSYDFNNKLVEITKGTDTFSNAYTGLGERVCQTVNEVTTDYVFDINSGLSQVLQESTPQLCHLRFDCLWAESKDVACDLARLGKSF